MPSDANITVNVRVSSPKFIKPTSKYDNIAAGTYVFKISEIPFILSY